jgi:hypothetical protein
LATGFKFEFDPEHQILLIVFAAEITEDTVWSALTAIEQFVAKHGPCNIVRDYSDSDGLPSQGFIQRLAQRRPIVQPGWQHILIAPRTVLFGVSRQLQILRNESDGDHYRIVRSRAEAWMSLGIAGEPTFVPVGT